MAYENKWTGAVSGLIDTAGNWTPTTPATTAEAALFLAEFTGGNPPSGAATDMDNLNTTNLALLKVGPGWTSSIGGSGAPLQLCADQVWYRGTAGKLWYADGTGNGGNTLTDLFTVDSTAPDPLNHDCTDLAAGSGAAVVTWLDVLRGKCTLSGGTVTNATCGRRNANVPEADLTISASAVVTTQVELWGGGRVTCSIDPVLARIVSGTWVQNTAVITTLHVFGGSVTLNKGGSYTTVRHYGGVIDCTQQGGIKTFANYYKYPGAVLLGENDPSCVSITNRFDVTGS